MRIATLIYSLAGGGGRVAADLALSLKHHTHSIYYIGSDPQFGTGIERALESARIPVKRALNADLQKELAEFRPDVILYHWWPLPANTYDPFLLKKFAPSILINHYSASPPAGFDFYVAVSRFGTRFMSHLPHKKIEVIYNGLELANYRTDRKPHDHFINVRVSSLEAKKISLDYLDFIAGLDIQDSLHIIVGEGEQKQKLLQRISDNPIKYSRIKLTGRLDSSEVRELLLQCDVSCYITDTHLEIHSISLLEKTALGVVIISEPRGGIPEQVIHYETGFLSHDKSDLKRYTELLARDRQLLAWMSDNSRRFAERFSLEKTAEAYNQLLEFVTG